MNDTELSNGYFVNERGDIVPGDIVPGKVTQERKKGMKTKQALLGLFAGMSLLFSVSGCGASHEATKRAEIEATAAAPTETAQKQLTQIARVNATAATQRLGQTATAEALVQGPATPRPGEIPHVPGALAVEASKPGNIRVLVSEILAGEGVSTRFEITSEVPLWVDTKGIKDVASIVWELCKKYYPEYPMTLGLKPLTTSTINSRRVGLEFKQKSIESNSPTAVASTNIDTNVIQVAMDRLKNSLGLENKNLGLELTEGQIQWAIIADEFANVFTKLTLKNGSTAITRQQAASENQAFSTSVFTVFAAASQNLDYDSYKRVVQNEQAGVGYSLVTFTNEEYEFARWNIQQHKTTDKGIYTFKK